MVLSRVWTSLLLREPHLSQQYKENNLMVSAPLCPVYPMNTY
jgi:hypothetical protein